MRNLIFIFIITIFFTSCASVRYVSDHLENQQLSQYQSYNIEGECARGVSKILETRVENALNKYLVSKGFSQSDNPDLLVQFFIKEQHESYISQECNYYGRWVYGNHCSVKVVNYKEGSIVIDIIDTNNNSIIWHGAMYGPSFENMQNPNEKINNYIENLMDKFLYDNSVGLKDEFVEN